MTDKEHPIPEALQAQADEINQQWLKSTGFKVEPYWQYSEFSDDFRFRLVNEKTGEVLTDYLKPDKADGHTYMLFIAGAQKQFLIGHQKGKMAMIEHHLRDTCKQNNIKFNELLSYLQPLNKTKD